jgi:hypothetical protein
MTVFAAPFGAREATLDQTGTYTLAVSSDGGSTGTYPFTLLDITDRVDEFSIAFGDTVADGVPAAGAGNLEETYGRDRYRFDAAAGQQAVFEAIAGAPDELRWRLLAPDGSEVFFDDFAYEQVSVTLTGTYTLVVSGRPSTYSFRLFAEPTEPLAVDVDVLPRCIRNDGLGHIPIVLFGNADVDVDDVDLHTVELAGMPVVTLFGWPFAVELDVDRDGHDDVLLLIDDVAGGIPADATEATMRASLADGTTIAGSDQICVRAGR